jgi:hypothetical protein
MRLFSAPRPPSNWPRRYRIDKPVKPRIPCTKPSITDLGVRYATDAAANGWGEHCVDGVIGGSS